MIADRGIRSGPYAVKLLWILTGVGLLFSAISVFSGFYRAHLNQNWMNTSAVENEVWHSLHGDFESFQIRAFHESTHVLDGDVDVPGAVEEELKELNSNPKLDESSAFWKGENRLRILAMQGMDLYARARKWRETQNQVNARISTLGRSCSETIRDLRAFMTSQEGNLRLQAIADGAAKQPGTTLDSSLRLMAEVREDINTLELLIERLNGVATTDAFLDLRDNHLAPSLQRLGRNFERMETVAPNTSLVLGRLEKTLSDTLLDASGTLSEMLASGTSGALVPFIRSRIQHSLELNQLNRELLEWSHACGTEIDVLQEAVAQKVKQGQVVTNEKMLVAEKTVGGISLLSTLAFLGLAIVISRNIGRQISIADEAHEALRINARALEKNVVQLEEATKAAQAASKAKSEFLANMSHEMRTPLHAVIGLSSVLIETKLTEEQLDYTKSMKCSAEALLSVIDDVLDMSKIESGKMTIAQAPLDLANPIAEAAAVVSSRMKEKQLKLIQTFAPGIPRDVIGDSPRLRQVLINLLGNAVKFTEAGSIELIVATQRTNDTHVWVRFDVVDTGCGINWDIQSRLFKSFEQGDTSLSRRYGGTGLGLAISRQLCELMGGEIGLESSTEKGSRFWFTLCFGKVPGLVRELTVPKPPAPVPQVQFNTERLNHIISIMPGTEVERRATVCGIFSGDGKSMLKVLKDGVGCGNAKEIEHGAHGLKGVAGEVGAESLYHLAQRMCDLARKSRTHEASELLPLLLAEFDAAEAFLSKPSATPVAPPVAAPVRSDSAKRRILVVDDIEMNRKVTSTILRVSGYEVDLANDGAQALEKATNKDYDAILMDLMMPVMNGEEAARAIRKLNNGRGRTPILALTASGLEAEHARCLQAGMNTVLTKPISKDRLLAALEEYVPAHVG